MKTFFIDNHGCAKNQVDAEEMAARLERDGWNEAPSAEGAELIIVNSCGFIEEAKKESIEAVMAIRQAFPGKRILFAGCLAQRYADALHEGLAEADGIFGNGDLSLLGQAALAALEGRRQALAPAIMPYAPERRKRLRGFPGMAYLKIAEGCSNKCSFCAIPVIRGGLSSRDTDDAVKEFEELVRSGVYEVCIIGQDLGSYGLDRSGRSLLPELLEGISSVSGDFRVRMLYIHPDRFPLRILDSCSRDARIVPYFDLPFQHASERILKAMNRSGNAERYLSLLGDIRSALPDAVVRSTLLLGFPGEEEEDFAALRNFQDAARLDWLGAFAYSREEDTPAYALKGRVAKKTALARKKAVESAQEAISAQALARWVGRDVDVLIEESINAFGEDGPAGEDEEFAIARGPMNAPEVDGAIVVVGGEYKPGDVARVRISAVRGLDLEAVPRA